MLTTAWLIGWILSETPRVEAWNNWLIGLIVCIVIDLIGTKEAL